MEPCQNGIIRIMAAEFDRKLLIRVKQDANATVLSETAKLCDLTVGVHSGKFRQKGSLEIIKNAYDAGVGYSVDVVTKVRVMDLNDGKSHEGAGEVGSKMREVKIGNSIRLSSDENNFDVLVNRLPIFPDDDSKKLLVFGEDDVVCEVISQSQTFVELSIISIKQGKCLFGNHGISSPTHDIESREKLLSQVDIDLLKAIPVEHRQNLKEIVLSFVGSKEQFLEAKQELADLGFGNSLVVAKIETGFGVKNLEDIAEATDKIVIGCGDLQKACQRGEFGGSDVDSVLNDALIRLQKCGFDKEVFVARGIGDDLTEIYNKTQTLGHFNDETLDRILSWDTKLGRAVNYWMTAATVGIAPAMLPTLIGRFVEDWKLFKDSGLRPE